MNKNYVIIIYICSEVIYFEKDYDKNVIVWCILEWILEIGDNVYKDIFN